MVPQVGEFRDGELEHEVSGKAIEIAPHGSDEPLGLNAVEPGRVRIQHDALCPDLPDELVNFAGGGEGGVGDRDRA